MVSAYCLKVVTNIAEPPDGVVLVQAPMESLPESVAEESILREPSTVVLVMDLKWQASYKYKGSSAVNGARGSVV